MTLSVVGVALTVAVLTGIALRTPKEWVRRTVAALLFGSLVVLCTVVFEANVRLVISEAQAHGEFSEQFLLGVRRLRDWTSTDRAFALLLSSALFALALPRRKG